MSNLRAIFSPAEQERISPILRRALSSLKLRNLDDLEKRFLATEAFLKPWANFRDSIFVAESAALSRPTTIIPLSDASPDPNQGISRLQILWYYNQFDEGMLRQDERANTTTKQYTLDRDTHGSIDKSKWKPLDHERLLYAWLLQEFKVGKAINPWGFEFFEGKNICSAWETVFVPIVDIVRASYSVKGRKHYGRLALAIESMCPSRLAFPEVNVSASNSFLLSPTPFRLVSIPKKQKPVKHSGSKFHEHIHDQVAPYVPEYTGLTKKQYDETEKELRNVYPQYGALVDRPKFKVRMAEWLQEQRRRADWRKAGEDTQEDKDHSPTKIRGSKTPNDHDNPEAGSASSLKRYSDTIRRSISMTFSKKPSKEAPKSPLHGVAHPLGVPYPDSPHIQKQEHSPRERGPIFDYGNVSPVRPSPQQMEYYKNKELPAIPSNHGVQTPSHHATQRGTESVYETIRKSNPYSQGNSKDQETFNPYSPTENLPFSPMSQLDNIPSPLRVEPKHGYIKTRNPSYEGSGYASEISLTDLQSSRRTRTPTNSDADLTLVPTIEKKESKESIPRRLLADYFESDDEAAPTPAHTVEKKESNDSIPKRLLRDYYESDDEYDNVQPQIPPRVQVGGHRSGQTKQEEPRDLSRIVSKENIRAALQSSSQESLGDDVPPVPKVPENAHAMMSKHPNYRDGRLQTYNTHMFPRRGPAMAASASSKKTVYKEEEYEMQALGPRGGRHRRG